MSLTEKTEPKLLITPKKPAWGNAATESIRVCSLEEVMSEQLANDLHVRECNVYEEYVNSKQSPSAKAETTRADAAASKADQVYDEQLHNDFLIAQLLQLECDKEFDQLLKGQEDNRNRNSKVKLSYEKFKSVHPVNAEHEKEINSASLVPMPSDSESDDGK